MNAQQILQQVDQAFTGIPIPTVRVAPHQCDECDGIVDELQGRERETFSQAETGVFGNTRIHLIAPEAIHYYFPNILSKALASDEGDFLMDVLYFLGCASEHTRNQVGLFDKPQRQAVYQFLLYVQVSRQEEVTDYMCEEELAQALKDWA